MNETVNPTTGEVTNPQFYAALCDALAAACARVKAAPKDATNSFHHYNYASAECVIRTAREALAESGLSLGPVRAQVDRPGGDGPDILRRTIRITHRLGAYEDREFCWPIVPEKGRPYDKAFASADTTGLAYFLRDLLLMPRVDEGDNMDHNSRDRTRNEPEAGVSPVPKPGGPPPADETMTCPKCGSPMRKRNGKTGAFWGCTTYPQCKGTLPDGFKPRPETPPVSSPDSAEVAKAKREDAEAAMRVAGIEKDLWPVTPEPKRWGLLARCAAEAVRTGKAGEGWAFAPVGEWQIDGASKTLKQATDDELDKMIGYLAKFRDADAMTTGKGDF